MSVTKLHNFCIDERDPPLKERHPDDLLDVDEMEVTMNAEELDLIILKETDSKSSRFQMLYNS
jgi:hypothetical protein